jgi:hypothetical protein
VKREWQAGDVALVTEDGEEWAIALHCGVPRNLGWEIVRADRKTWTARVFSARPLVVIDPESREQVERLRDETIRALHQQIGFQLARGDAFTEVDLANAMQAALREFAEPTPPRCKAALIIKGEHFGCDEKQGHGLAHGSRDAEAIWGDS